jgi:hypothetical protein
MKYRMGIFRKTAIWESFGYFAFRYGTVAEGTNDNRLIMAPGIPQCFAVPCTAHPWQYPSWELPACRGAALMRNFWHVVAAKAGM